MVYTFKMKYAVLLLKGQASVPAPKGGAGAQANEKKKTNLGGHA